MNFLIAKNDKEIWSVYGAYSNKEDADGAKEKFTKSMYLLGLIKCQVVSENEVSNINQIGWENHVQFKNVPKRRKS